MKSNVADFDDEEVVALSVDLQNAKSVLRGIDFEKDCKFVNMSIIETCAKK